MRRIVFKDFKSPGDVVMLTAAVRDLHAANPGMFQTDVRTSADAIWLHNPYITRLNEHDAGVETIDCHYPLVHQANNRPYHFIHGYAQFLEERLGVRIPLTRFAGDIHLSADEQQRPLPFAELGVGEGFWIILAGGKYDFTAKWWNPASFQAVVDHFQGRIQFVQCGEAAHWHPPLNNVIQLVGRTRTRDFVLLMHHAAGVVCPVTFAMHLAAAVETRPGRPRRPCVVIAGAREPAHWEQYPGHQFLHTLGSLPCCTHDPCWRSRCQLVGDGDEKDRRQVCERPVQISHDLRIPKCMDLISPDDVIRAIERYVGDANGSVGNALRGVPAVVNGCGQPTHLSDEPMSPNPKSKIENPKSKILVDFRHGLGDAVQLTTVLAHLRHYHPDWQVDVAAGIGKLPRVGDRSHHRVPSGWRDASHHAERDDYGRLPLYHRFIDRDREALDRDAYRHVFDLSWDECPTAYADSPSTKAEHCVRAAFQLQPIAELCRYQLTLGERAWTAAKSYLESICDRNPSTIADGAPQRTSDGRFPVVLLHYQGNTSSERKDLSHELAARVCEAVIESGYVPVILDWDHRTPLADGVRIFNPGPDAPLWGGIGTGDCETLAALIAQSALFIGVDSGPLHVAGAVLGGAVFDSQDNHAVQREGESRREGEGENVCSDVALPSPTLPLPHSPPLSSPTPAIAVWTGHHPLHYFGLAEHVTHLVPAHHASLVRGDRAAGLAFFEKHYRHRVYRQLANELPALVIHMLTGEDFEQAANKEFLRQLRSTGFDESYYQEHKLAGLDYLGFGGWQQQYGRWLVESLDLKDKRLLDVGCACGSILRGLGMAGAVVQGVDVCEPMIRRGRDEWPDMAALLHVCDAVNLHLFADGSFDAIHTAQVAEHWRPELVPLIFRELARVTVPGGLMFCALDTEELFARQGRTIEHEDPTHVCIRPLSWWHEQLAANGWQLCTAEYESRLRTHKETFLSHYDWDWFVGRRVQ